MTIVLCFGAARFDLLLFGDVEAFERASVLLLFLGLLTVVNAAFDWLSLGFTRFLLRYGVEKGAAWPYAFALLDVVVALAFITALAAVLVLCVDLFDLFCR